MMSLFYVVFVCRGIMGKKKSGMRKIMVLKTNYFYEKFKEKLSKILLERYQNLEKNIF